MINGPINGTIPHLYRAIPRAPRLSTGDILIDNLGSRRSRAVRHAIVQADGTLAFVLLYSPDLNPIEQVVAKLKHWMRMAKCTAVNHRITVLGSIYFP
jgi:transposase